MDGAAKVWGGDWQGRVVERVRGNGYPNLLGLLAARPGASYRDLAHSLGGDVAPVPLVELHLREAAASGQLRAAVGESLGRYVRARLPGGWGVSPDVRFGLEFHRASMIAGWLESLGHFDPSLREVAGRVWAVVKGSSPPEDWLPSGASDPIIAGALSQCWPADW